MFDWNLGFSLITVIIAIIALFQTAHQTKLSNKQHLFDRRLKSYLRAKGLVNLCKDNYNHLQSENNEEPFFQNDLIFGWLTNNTYMYQQLDVLKHPLEQPYQVDFLKKCEELKNLSEEFEVNPLSWTKESNLGGFTMTKFSFEDKLRAVNMYLRGYGSNTVAKVYKVKNHSNILMWVKRYQKYGIDGLKVRYPKYDYDGNFKLNVLNWRKRHKASYPETALQFDISNPGTIATWQRKLDTKGVDALFTRRGRAKHMTTNNNKQAEKSELSELERLRAENRALRVENEYLKKLDALVQKRGHRKKNIKSSKN